VFVKHENHQPVGAFKVRGEVNLITQLSADEHRVAPLKLLTCRPALRPDSCPKQSYRTEGKFTTNQLGHSSTVPQLTDDA
jgi:hypothetical protein